MNLPAAIVEHLFAVTVESRSPAWLGADRNGDLTAYGGNLDFYGLQGLRKGDHIAATAYFLEGLLPLDAPRLVLSNAETISGAFADIHLISEGEKDWVLLLDANSKVDEQRRVQEALRRNQEHLHQSERMETVGRLAGGIAHDFNNLLTVIVGYTEMLLMTSGDDDNSTPAREIRNAAERAAMLTKQLLTFSRRQVVKPALVQLNEAVAGLQEMLRRLISENVQIEIRLATDLPIIRVDKGQLEQVILNLAINARDAMPRGGRLTIETGGVEIARMPLTGRSDHDSPARFAVLAVSDTGVGMDEETCTRIFEPFFTTKAPGKGTGLGLATVHGIVQQAGGGVRVESHVGRGTRFEIHFPYVEASHAVVTSMEKSPAVPSGETATILLVEDDKSVRRLLSEMLQRYGYQVVEAPGGPEALLLAEDHLQKVDLLLSDVVMPEMSGFQLAMELQKRRPDLRVVFMSGYSHETIVQQGELAAASRILQKPFTADELATELRKVLTLREMTSVTAQAHAH